MKNQKQMHPEDHILTWNNPSQDAVTAGQPVQTYSGWGVAHGDIASGESGTLYRRGQFEFAKATGTAVVQGQPLWWDGTNSRVSFTPTGTPPLGTASQAAASDDLVVDVDLNVVPPPAATRHTVTNAEAALNSNNGQVDIDTGWGVQPTSAPVVVRAITTGRTKSGFDIEILSGADVGKVRISGVAAGTQLDEGDIIEFVAFL